MSIQSDALLALAGAYMETGGDERARAEAKMWREPVICTHAVLADAEEDAEMAERIGLQQMRKRGLLVAADDPQAEQVRLRRLRAGVQRLSITAPGARGRLHGKRGKRK